MKSARPAPLVDPLDPDDEDGYPLIDDDDTDSPVKKLKPVKGRRKRKPKEGNNGADKA